MTLTKTITKAINKLPRFIGKKQIRGSTTAVLIYGSVILLLCLLFIGGWLYNGVTTGKFDLTGLTSFFSSCTSASALAAISFVVVMNIDKNHDGRPDAAELKAKEKSQNEVRNVAIRRTEREVFNERH